MAGCGRPFWRGRGQGSALLVLCALATVQFGVQAGAQAGAQEQTAGQTASAPVEWLEPRLLLREYPRYAREYRRYTPYYRALDELKQEKQAVEVLAFYGVWCKDSRREIPRLLKLVDQLAVEQDFYVQLVPVDEQRKRQDGGRPVVIEKTPTMVVYRNGEEIGRIVEKARPEIAVSLARLLRDTRDAAKPEGLSKVWRARNSGEAK